MNHLPIWGKGMSTKTTDMAAVAGCFRCHEILDARDIRRTDYLIQHAPSLLAERMTHAITETHALLIERGIIQVPDAEML